MTNQERYYSDNIVTLLVQKLKILGKKKIYSQYLDSQFL